MLVKAMSCAASLVLLLMVGLTAKGQAADPVRVGFSMSLSGALAPNGQQVLAALEIWRDDVNAAGGLLGRPIELVYYDDRSSPSNVPDIYTKLLTVDKVDLLLGPYATNMAAPAMPVIMQYRRTTIAIQAIGVNAHFKYDRYFAMVSTGPEGPKAFSRGFFEIAAAQNPKPATVAMISADAEFARNAADGAKENAKALGFSIVYDQTYPPATPDFGPIMRAVKAVDADIVFVAAYPPDTVGIIRATKEVDLRPRMFGGAMIGLLVTQLRAQLGPAMNNMIFMETFWPTFDFPGLQEMLAKYRAKVKDNKIDPFGYEYAPFGYAAGQVLAEAVTATRSLDHDAIAKYIHAATFQTVVGEIAYNRNGDWSEPRVFFTQFQDVQPNDILQFQDGKKQPILWPEQYRTGQIIYPYAASKR
jgi:branched-chain amino acid transport system substrate-binding protein